MMNQVNQKVQKIFMPTGVIKQQRELLYEEIQVFDYSFNRQSSSEDSHDDEVVIQDSESVSLSFTAIFKTKFNNVSFP